jgi:hypothetical protein
MVEEMLAPMDEEHAINGRSANQLIATEATLAPYDFPSIHECVEVVGTEEKSGCESRFARIVNEQVKRYRTALQPGDPLMKIGSNGVDPDRSWLDAPYLYRINYGPASKDDVESAYAALKAAADLSERGKFTLLDRRMAHEFCKKLFPAQLEKCAFCIDWTAENAEAQREARAYQLKGRCPPISPGIGDFGRRLSPFEFNPFAAESEALRACEEYCVNCIWDKKYAPCAFGDDARPPMAAVATDMMNMVEFLSRMPRDKPRLISECLRDFLASIHLYSISQPVMDPDAVCRDFLWDMFMIVVCCPRGYHELEGWDRKGGQSVSWQPYAEFHDFRDSLRRATDNYQFPGGAILGLPLAPYSSAESEMARSLESINAGYIHSGPYRLQLTNQLREHLTLGDNRRIRLYWDDPRLSRRLLRPAGARPGKSLLRTKPAILGDSFSLYTEHALGR